MVYRYGRLTVILFTLVLVHGGNDLGHAEQIVLGTTMVQHILNQRSLSRIGS